MNLMEDWLTPTIQDELTKALHWKEGGPNREQPKGGNAGYIDDGSNLRIQSSKTGVVQISKFLTFDAPIQATLSDKTTRIDARISSPATRDYEEQHRTRFTKDKLGGLIQLREFEIVATHLGPRSNWLTLLVNRFQSLGSDGSAAFSMPRPIEMVDKGCYALLDKLMCIRTQEKALSSQGISRESSAGASSIHSQMGLVVGSIENRYDSQATFATQVPTARKNHGSPGPIGMTDDLDVCSIAKTPKFLDKMSNLTEEMKISPPETAKIAELVSAQRLKSKPNSTIIARNLLRNFDQGAPAKSIDTTGTVVGYNKEKLIIDRETSAGVPHEEFDVTFGDLTKIYKREDRVQPSSVLPSITEHNTSNSPSESPYFAKEPKNLATVTTQEIRIQHDQELHVNVTDDGFAASKSPQRPLKERKLNDKIRGWEVRISKVQQVLLNRSDSWLPAEPGQREPKANLPITLLQTFNHGADHCAKSPTRLPESSTQRPATRNVEEASGSQASDSDSEIASEQWPPSPDRDQLPPDSSPPGEVQSKEISEVTGRGESPILGSPPCPLPNTDPAQKPSNDRPDNGELNSGDNEVPNEANQSALSSSTENWPLQQSTNQLLQDRQQQTTTGAVKDEINFQDRAKNGTQTNDSRPSTVDSDIEMTIPIPLANSSQPQVNVGNEKFPSTATQSKQPFTQVRRTPYANDPTRNEPNLVLRSGSPPPFGEIYEAPRTFEEANAQISSTASTFVSKPDSNSTSSNTFDNLGESSDKPVLQLSPAQQPTTSRKFVPSFPVRRSEGKEVEFNAVDTSSTLGNAKLQQLLSECIAPASITLKQGEQVKIIKTVDETLVHGFVGKVVGFMDTETFENCYGDGNGFQDLQNDPSHEWPVIRFELADNYRRDWLCQPQRWNIGPGDENNQASRLQIPLIHHYFTPPRIRSRIEQSNKMSGDCSPLSPLSSPASAKRVLQVNEHATSNHNSKRSKINTGFALPNLSSRRGKSSKPLALDTFGVPDDLRDPAFSARQNRENWFAARRSSESSSAKDSPSLPPQCHVVSGLDRANGRRTGSSGFATSVSGDQIKRVSDDVITNASLISLADITSNAHGANPSPPTHISQIPIEPSIPSEIEYQGIVSAIVSPQGESRGSGSTLVKPAAGPQVCQSLISEGRHHRNEDLPVIVNLRVGGSSVPGSQAETRTGVSTPDTLQSDALGSRSPPPMEVVKARTPSPQSVFDNFKENYPDYLGDIKHFLTLCKKIEKLWRLDQLHKSLWDDFLIRNRIEYAHYIQQCVEDGDDPLLYQKFYNDEIDEPKYRKKILTPPNLESVICGIGPRSALSDDTSLKSTPTRTSFSAIISGEYGDANGELQNAKKAAVMIDLTDDDSKHIGSPNEGTKPQSVDTSEISSGLRQKKSFAAFKGKGKDFGADGPSSMTHEGPLNHSRADARLEGQDQGSDLSWWQDEDAPFKSFVRSYVSIRPGSGNAFATPADVARGQIMFTNKVRELRYLNVLGWSLGMEERMG